MLNRWVLGRDRQTATECAEVTRSVRLFQTRAAATGKVTARSPTVRSQVRLTINDEHELKRSRWRPSTSATWQSSSVRYAGADPCRHLYTRTACLNIMGHYLILNIIWQDMTPLLRVVLDFHRPYIHSSAGRRSAVQCIARSCKHYVWRR